MNKNKLILYGFLLWIVTFSVSNFNVLASTGASRLTIIGDVAAVDWNEQGDITEIAISVMLYPQDSTQLAYTEDYLVGQNEKGKELLTHINAKVEATGRIVISADGYKTIYIERFLIIEEDYYREESYLDQPRSKN